MGRAGHQRDVVAHRQLELDVVGVAKDEDATVGHVGDRRVADAELVEAVGPFHELAVPADPR